MQNSGEEADDDKLVLYGSAPACVAPEAVLEVHPEDAGLASQFDTVYSNQPSPRPFF